MENLVNYIVTDFDLGRKDKYKLSVLFEDNFMAYLISEYFSNKIIGLKEVALNQQFTNEDTYLSGNYAKVNVAFANRKYTLIPQGLLDVSDYADALQLLHNINANEVVHAQDITEHKTTAVQAVDDKKYKSLTNAELFTIPFILLDSLSKFNLQEGFPYIFLGIYREYIEISVIKDYKLVYLNTFLYNNSSDVLYYVMFVLEQLNLKASGEEIFILRNTGKSEDAYLQLEKFCKKVTIIPFPKNLIIDKGLMGFSYQNHYTLLSLSLCE